MTDTEMTGGGMGLAQTLPEGVLRGENVPPENDAAEYEQGRVEEVVGELKAHGRPFTEMSDDQLHERARDLLDRAERQEG